MLVTVRRGKTNPEGEGVGRAVREGRRRQRRPDAACCGGLGAGGPRGAGADGGSAVPGGGPGGRRRGGDRPLGPCRSGVGADEPGGVDDRRDAGPGTGKPGLAARRPSPAFTRSPDRRSGEWGRAERAASGKGAEGALRPSPRRRRPRRASSMPQSTALRDDGASGPYEVAEPRSLEHLQGTPIPLRVHRGRPAGDALVSENCSLSERPGRLPSRSRRHRTAPAVAAPHRPRRLLRGGTPDRRRHRSGTVRGEVRWSRAIDAQAFPRSSARHRGSVDQNTRPCQASWLAEGDGPHGAPTLKAEVAARQAATSRIVVDAGRVSSARRKRFRTRQDPGHPSRTSVTATLRHSFFERMNNATTSPTAGLE